MNRDNTSVPSNPVSSRSQTSGPASQAIPVRGLHLAAPVKSDLEAALEFIRESLPREGVNTFILEFDGYDFAYDFKSRPEFANSSALNKDDVRKIAAACRENGIELIPQMECLGHQSWGKRTGRILQNYPEFDETPGKYPNNEGIYCRSYCPLHPKVHEVVFDLIDELAEACQTKTFHVGMDEVFIIADPDCRRCQGKDPAELFAQEVKVIHDHLKSIGCRTWIWGDRFIDGEAMMAGDGYEASMNGTHPAVDQVPKDIVICDWHYKAAPETTRFFAEKGFEVVSCPWRETKVAMDQLANIQVIRADKDKAVADLALGMVQTTWAGFAPFIQAYGKLEGGAAPDESRQSEAAQCFRALFKAIREK